MTEQEYIALIRELITDGKLDQALDQLIGFGKELNNNLLDDEARQLSGRFAHIDKENNLGLIKNEDYNLELNNIQWSLLDLLRRYEKGELMTTIGKSNGRFVHNIPSRMEKNLEAICSVRIAKDDEKLLKNFELSDASKPEDVEISPTMSVELIDPSGGKVFGIRMVSPLQVQKITEHTFTEWDFAITPLSTGKHLIYLYAHFIEDFDGEETRRTISFKRNIEITTEKVEEQNEWQPTNIIISRKNKDKFLPGIDLKNENKHDTEKKNEGKNNEHPIEKATDSSSGNGAFGTKILSSMLLKAAIFTVTFGMAGWFIINRMSNNTNTASMQIKNSVTFNIETSIKAHTLMIGGDTIKCWKFNADSSQIVLESMIPDDCGAHLLNKDYFIAVSGKYGSCSSRLLIRFDTTSVYDLICHQEPQVKKYSKLLITSPMNPVIYLNGTESYPDSTYKLASMAGQVFSCFILENSKYDIEVKYANQTFLCSKKSIELSSDIKIDLSCEKQRNPAPSHLETFYVKLITPFKLTDLSVDNKRHNFNNGPTTIINDNLMYSAKVKVSKGQHSFSVSDSKNNFKCASQIVRVEKNTDIVFNCVSLIPSYQTKIRFVNGTKYAQELVIIKFDGKVLPVKAINVEPKDLLFTIDNVKKGPHIYTIEALKNNKNILNCPAERINVSDNREFKFTCKSEQTEQSSNFQIKLRIARAGNLMNDKFEVKMDDKMVGSKISVDNSGNEFIRQVKGDLIFTIDDVPRGQHNFSVVHVKNVLSCKTVRLDIKKSQEFNYECNLITIE